MSDTSSPIEFLSSTDAVIKQQALGAATSLLDYVSHGHLLIIGETVAALELAAQLPTLSVSVLQIHSELERPSKHLTEDGIHVYQSPRPLISGYLGAFQVQVDENERVHDIGVLRMTETGYFDLVLDLSESTLIGSRLPPFGYFTGSTDSQLAAAMEQLPKLVGEFEKPRYFDYNKDICAHSRSALVGCTNCLDVCVADAITKDGEGIAVNPYLCQGCGTCSSVCPTGAMTYAYPRPSQAIDRTRDMIDKAATGTATAVPVTLLIYSQSDDEATDQVFEQGLPAHVMPVAVEEVSAFGIDYWASMVCAGFEQIVVQVGENPENPNTVAMRKQAKLFGTIVVELGISADAVQCLSADSPEVRAVLNNPPESQRNRLSSARFSTHNDKRQTFRMAIDQLAAAHPPAQPVIELPVGSPFGKISLNVDACTLCMACVSVCPAGALMDGQELPKIRFVESNCVQCGLCDQACPEDAIALTTQFTFDSTTARETRTLNEEEPFKCIRCHTPFATQKMIDNMTEKLAGHWMFGDDKATRRLKMCGDCRVMDMFEDEGKGIDVHRDA